MPFSKKKERGCPTCDGVDAKSCMRCRGKTRMCDWHHTRSGWAHISQVGQEEVMELFGDAIASLKDDDPDTFNYLVAKGLITETTQAT